MGDEIKALRGGKEDKKKQIEAATNLKATQTGNSGILQNKDDDWTIYAMGALQTAKALKQDPQNTDLQTQFKRLMGTIHSIKPEYATEVAFLAKNASDSADFDAYVKTRAMNATKNAPAMGGVNSLYNLISGSKGAEAIKWQLAGSPMAKI